MSFGRDGMLLLLIKNKDNEEAKTVIKKEKLYSTVDRSKNTLLHYAAGFKNSEIVKFLIDSGSFVDAKNNLGETPLITSLRIYLPCKEVIELLLKAGASIFLKDNVHQKAVDIVNSITWLREDVRRFEILKIFLEQRTDMNVFHDLLSRADANIITSLLKTSINLSKADIKGRTIVHMLAENLNPGVIEQLHGRNFNPDACDVFKQTPLIYAIRKNNIHAVEFLLNEGADVEAILHPGLTPLQIAICRRKTNSNAKRIVQVLVEHGANLQVVRYNINLDFIETIFDMVLEDEIFGLPEFLLANLVWQEALGVTVTDLTRIRINENSRLKSYFDLCQQQISTQIYKSISVADVMMASKRKLELYLRNEELASKLINYQTSICYFNTILHEIISKASRMIALKKNAAQIICKLAKMDYNSYPFVFDEIVNYLEEPDIEHLNSI